MNKADNSRIAKNTIFLYVRMMITMIVSLYTSRIVLQVLGASDYGLYNVVAGVLAMFSMFNGALTVGTQRFLNFAMGENAKSQLKHVFSAAWGIHIIIASMVFVIGQTIGLWFVCNVLNIPEGRLNAAVLVYEFSLLGFLFSLLQLPFQSSIIAHERMNIYAYLSIVDVIVKLLMVIIVQYVDYDKLILYGAFIMIIHIVIATFYVMYCRRKFEECTFRITIDKQIAKEMAVYSGWNLLGGTMGPITNQGVNIILNIFSGTIINAARGLSITVNTYVMQLVNNFQIAANPQIVKLFAAKEFDAFYRLIINNCRVAIYLFLLIAVPIFIEVKHVLTVWLGEYPEWTDTFIRIILIQSFFQAVNKPINMSVHATGKIKWMNVMNAVAVAFILPLCYLMLYLGFPPTVVFWLNVLFFVFDDIICLCYSHKYSNLPVSTILSKVYMNAILGALMMFVLPGSIAFYVEEGWIRFFVVCFVSLLNSVIVIYFWGMTPGMKNMFKRKVKGILKIS